VSLDQSFDDLPEVLAALEYRALEDREEGVIDEGQSYLVNSVPFDVATAPGRCR
jgi:hypothetical protein